MKISRIYIEDYLRFKNFELNLTYPPGHEKEGQPLDKICIIGKSGTCKTKLLELINKYVSIANNTFLRDGNTALLNPSVKSGKKIDFDFSFPNWHLLSLSFNRRLFSNKLIPVKIQINPSDLIYKANVPHEINELFKILLVFYDDLIHPFYKHFLIYFPAENNKNISLNEPYILSQTLKQIVPFKDLPQPFFNDIKEWYNNLVQKQYHLFEHKVLNLEYNFIDVLRKLNDLIYDQIPKLEKIQVNLDHKFFLQNSTNDIIINSNDFPINLWWKEITLSLADFRHEWIRKSIELSEAIVRTGDKNHPKILKLEEEIIELNKTNPIVKLADNYLDQLLKPLKLSVHKFVGTLEIKQHDEVYFKQLNSEKPLSFEELSTGTKQLILTTLPLYYLEPKNTIILMDEPERSLYPDMQYNLMQYYTDPEGTLLKNDNQTFFVTHSPIMLSFFEPWEIVELIFDDDGNVIRDDYRIDKSKNHVDNYMYNPTYLDWNSIYSRIFDFEHIGNPERIEGLMELNSLKKQLQQLTTEGKKGEPEFIEKQNAFIELAKKLDISLVRSAYEKN